MSHQRVAATTPTAHHPARRRLAAPGSRVVNHTRTSGSTANADAPFTPPIAATASADHAATRRGRAPSRAPSRGTSTHGASAYGSCPADWNAVTATVAGASAYAHAATTRPPAVDTPTARATRWAPQSDASTTSVIQARCTIHGGRATARPSDVNAPIGNRYPTAWFWTRPKPADGSQGLSARPR